MITGSIDLDSPSPISCAHVTVDGEGEVLGVRHLTDAGSAALKKEESRTEQLSWGASFITQGFLSRAQRNNLETPLVRNWKEWNDLERLKQRYSMLSSDNEDAEGADMLHMQEDEVYEILERLYKKQTLDKVDAARAQLFVDQVNFIRALKVPPEVPLPVHELWRVARARRCFPKPYFEFFISLFC